MYPLAVFAGEYQYLRPLHSAIRLRLRMKMRGLLTSVTNHAHMHYFATHFYILYIHVTLFKKQEWW